MILHKCLADQLSINKKVLSFNKHVSPREIVQWIRKMELREISPSSAKIGDHAAEERWLVPKLLNVYFEKWGLVFCGLCPSIGGES